MERIKGSKNKNLTIRPITSKLSPRERIHFLANLIIDRMLQDQQCDSVLLKKIIKKDL